MTERKHLIQSVVLKPCEAKCIRTTHHQGSLKVLIQGLDLNRLQRLLYKNIAQDNIIRDVFFSSCATDIKTKTKNKI